MPRESVMASPARALFSIESDDLARELFRMFDQHQVVSGWEAVSFLNRTPPEIEGVLTKLSNEDVLKSQGSGLDGVYYLTGTGYKVREALKNPK